MAIKKVLLLGNPELYEKSVLCEKSELHELKKVAADLHDTMFDFKKKYELLKSENEQRRSKILENLGSSL